jgi:hypothetical protein
MRDKIARACEAAGRQPSEITLIAVSKTVDAGRVAEAIRAGVTDLGENWVQEAMKKRPEVEAMGLPLARWHMIGHLQTNKTKKALEVFDVFQGVDSLHLAQEVNKRAAEAGKTIPILIEVNTSGEASKFGIDPGQAAELAAPVLELKQLSLTGLMTIGPGLSIADPERSRPCFRLLRVLRLRLEGELRIQLPWLSMGMSSDYAVAIQEGSTMLRIGTAIFGPRE